jgi:hypothetical protein
METQVEIAREVEISPDGQSQRLLGQGAGPMNPLDNNRAAALGLKMFCRQPAND